MVTLTASPSAAGLARPRFERIREFLDCVGASVRCAAAVESCRAPSQRDLDILGISEIMPRTYNVGR